MHIVYGHSDLGREDWDFESGTFQVQDSETGQVMQLTEDADIEHPCTLEHLK